MKLPSDQEQTFIFDYITLPLLLTVLERDRKVFESSALKIKAPYLSLFESAISKVERLSKTPRKHLDYTV
ncbi:hypothetical protein [Ammoniphilus sp. 3BR4]|uniref:hypothetical protein n=1 Tax=Ammoniphilus sp. 3BR4 TaxID=3158265 RepID=UPI003467EC74